MVRQAEAGSPITSGRACSAASAGLPTSSATTELRGLMSLQEASGAGKRMVEAEIDI